MDSHTVELPVEQPVGELEEVVRFHGAMPTGVTMSHQGRIFVNFPKWGDDVRFTVAEVRNGEPVAYSDEGINRTDPDDLAGTLVSVQSVVVDPADRLWILDTGSPLWVDLTSNQVVKTILFPQDVALPATYLNDVRFHLRRGTEGVAYTTGSSDKGPNGIVMADLATGQSWRRLHDHPSTKAEELADFVPVVEGRPVNRKPDGSIGAAIAMGSDGIAIGADGTRCTIARSPADGFTAWPPMRWRTGRWTVMRWRTGRWTVMRWRKPWSLRVIRAVPLTVSSQTRRAISTRRTMSTTRSFDVPPTSPGHGRRWRRIPGCYGRTPSRLPVTAAFTSLPISCTGRRPQVSPHKPLFRR
jgi:sugar lactone lactonase YvrE